MHVVALISAININVIGKYISIRLYQALTGRSVRFCAFDDQHRAVTLLGLPVGGPMYCVL